MLDGIYGLVQSASDTCEGTSRFSRGLVAVLSFAVQKHSQGPGGNEGALAHLPRSSEVQPGIIMQQPADEGMSHRKVGHLLVMQLQFLWIFPGTFGIAQLCFQGCGEGAQAILLLNEPCRDPGVPGSIKHRGDAHEDATQAGRPFLRLVLSQQLAHVLRLV